MSNPNIDNFVTEAAKREARRQYQHNWRRNNPDKVKAINDRYWEKKGREYLASLAQEGRA